MNMIQLEPFTYLIIAIICLVAGLIAIVSVIVEIVREIIRRNDETYPN